MSPPTYGYLLPTQEATGRDSARIGALIELGARAEQLGFDTIWVPDSPFQYGVPDPLMVLAALAARTERVKLAPGMLLAALRQPTLLAQQLASLDALASGRLLAGLGLGFPSPGSERQFAAAGVQFAGRISRLEETITLMRALWASDGKPVSYEGKHVSVRDVVLSPAPVHSGGPPIWLAGGAPPAQHRVGRLADGWLPYLPTVDAYAAGWRLVQDAAAEVGRPQPPVPALYITIAIHSSPAAARDRLRTHVEQWYGRPLEVVESLQATFAGTADGLAEHLESYTDAGARHIVLRVADDAERGLEQAAAAIGMRSPVS